jgi:hypothetical protein
LDQIPAYEQTPDLGIDAGEDFSTEIKSVSESSVMVYSVSEKTIEIHLNSSEYLGGVITITNLVGQSVAEFNADSFIIKRLLNVPPGWYAVTIKKDGKQVNRAVILH